MVRLLSVRFVWWWRGVEGEPYYCEVMARLEVLVVNNSFIHQELMASMQGGYLWGGGGVQGIKIQQAKWNVHTRHKARLCKTAKYFPRYEQLVSKHPNSVVELVNQRCLMPKELSLYTRGR
jgi:hypothetical protein